MFYTVQVMKPFKPPTSPLVRTSYYACRHGGAPPDLARAELALPPGLAYRLEQLFRSRPGGGADAMRPSFARHAAHVGAVKAQGGYPALAERRRR